MDVPGRTTPYTILIDSAESKPWDFSGLKDKQQRPIEVLTRVQSLGRHPHSYGDYSIDGFIGRVAVERKSLNDIHGTILGWPGDQERFYSDLECRRDRFEQELENFQHIDAAIIIVEASFEQCIKEAPTWGKKSVITNQRILANSIISYQQRFPRVQWAFAGNRKLGRRYCFRWLDRYWRNFASLELAGELP